MAKAEVININNEKVRELELNDEIFGVKVRRDILHEIVRMQRANRRAGTACTKSRGEVRGSKAKPWRQKGTGRARAGHKRSPLWRGGGTVFGPKPRSYEIRMPKKVRRLGLRMALSARFSEDNLRVLDEFRMEEFRTRKFVETMNALDLSNALIVVPERDEKLEKSSRNVPGFKVITSAGLNVYDILLHHKLVILEPCLGQLEERLLS